MSTFAKLFDVADTQVLFMVTDDEGDPSLKMTTEINDMEITQTMAFRNSKDSDAAWDKAAEVLIALNQESAERFYAQMLQTVSIQPSTQEVSK